MRQLSNVPTVKLAWVPTWISYSDAWRDRRPLEVERGRHVLDTVGSREDGSRAVGPVAAEAEPGRRPRRGLAGHVDGPHTPEVAGVVVGHRRGVARAQDPGLADDECAALAEVRLLGHLDVVGRCARDGRPVEHDVLEVLGGVVRGAVMLVRAVPRPRKRRSSLTGEFRSVPLLAVTRQYQSPSPSASGTTYDVFLVVYACAPMKSASPSTSTLYDVAPKDGAQESRGGLLGWASTVPEAGATRTGAARRALENELDAVGPASVLVNAVTDQLIVPSGRFCGGHVGVVDGAGRGAVDDHGVAGGVGHVLPRQDRRRAVGLVGGEAGRHVRRHGRSR